MVNASVPTLLRQQVDRWAQTWITAKFSRLLELRARDPGPFNYPIEVFANGGARPSTSMFDTALGVARSKMISSFVTHE